jgi:hypothetical protein
MFNPNLVAELKQALGEDLYYISDPHIQATMFGVDDDMRASWHVDSFSEGHATYLRSHHYRFARVGVYFQANTECDGGGISVLPRSHKFPVRTGLGGIDFRIKDFVQRSLARPCGRMLLTRAGDAVFFHSRLYHASTLPRGLDGAHVQGDLIIGGRARPSKYVLYWNACNVAMVRDFLRNAELRSSREKLGGVLFFTDYLRYSPSQGLPPCYVGAAHAAGVGIATAEESIRMRASHDFALKSGACNRLD